VDRAQPASAEETGNKRSYVTLPLAQLVPVVTKAAFKKRSPVGAALMVNWTAVVGPTLAADTEPRRLYRGQLTISCSGPMALELQHLQAALIDRINNHAGAKLVDRLRFVQDHFPSKPHAPALGRVVEREQIDGVEGPLAIALADLLQAIKQRR
jgi:hypothetical protein